MKNEKKSKIVSKIKHFESVCVPSWWTRAHLSSAYIEITRYECPSIVVTTCSVIDPGEFSTRLPVYNARKSIQWAAVGSPWIIETRGTRSGSGRDEEAPVTSGEMGFSESELHDGRCLTNKRSSLLEGTVNPLSIISRALWMIVIIFRNMKYCVFGLYSEHEFLIYSLDQQ